MARMGRNHISNPHETRSFPRGKMEIVKLENLVFGKATFEPGWKWSESLKPIVGTESCMVSHNGYCVSGRMHVKMDDGTEMDVGPGDVFVIGPGHDAWIVGNEPCVLFDVSGAAIYAVKQAAAARIEAAMQPDEAPAP
jgi:hypothetical protein